MLSRISLLLVAGLVSVAGAQEQARSPLTARELFYSAAPAAQAPAKASVKAQAKPAAPKKPVATEAVNTENKAVPAPRAETAPRPETAALAEGVQIVPAVSKVANAPAGPPLGLKYTILKKSGDTMAEVPANSVFHAGDRIQITVESNGPGYLYIVSQGSSGTWKPVFPSPEVEEGDNHINGFRTYVVPPKSRMVFDEQKGTEKLFIVFSREPEPSLERMIYSLRDKSVAPASAPQAPKTSQPPAGSPKAKTLMVMAQPIDNGMVGNLRQVYARDLVIERVDEKTPGERKETAVYVVNPTGSPDSRLVADLELVHQ